MINKTRLCRNREYEEDFVILFMWMLILGLKRARVTKDDISHGDLYCDFSQKDYDDDKTIETFRLSRKS